MKNIRSTKGITLIALVITIIVLLILVAISIVTLTGENGVLTKVNTAKEKTEIAEATEQAKLDISNYIADKLEKGESTALDDSIIQSILSKKEKSYVKEAKKSSFTTSKSGYEIPYSDLYTIEKPPVPEGFYEVGGTIDTGFVISDVQGDDLNNTNQGNQFVWVPVPDISKFIPIEGYRDKELLSWVPDCSEPFVSGYESEQEEYENMYNSVKNNHGFYIGRYEAGKDNSGNVVVKKGATVYDNVPWGNSMTDIGTSGAVYLSQNFAKKQEYTSVTSTLVYGVQWDATMQFFDSDYINGACDENSYVRDSTGRGYYGQSSPPTTTGSNDDYAVKNIYDMAGNIIEWTMEACYTDRRVSRGGNYFVTGSGYPASSRSSSGPDLSNRVGFRIALYLK